jgi:hypothetical protein
VRADKPAIQPASETVGHELASPRLPGSPPALLLPRARRIVLNHTPSGDRVDLSCPVGASPLLHSEATRRLLRPCPLLGRRAWAWWACCTLHDSLLALFHLPSVSVVVGCARGGGGFLDEMEDGWMDGRGDGMDLDGRNPVVSVR